MVDSTVSTRAFMELTLKEASARACIHRLHGQISTLQAQVCSERTESSLLRVEMARMQVCLQSANNQLAASVDNSILRSEAFECVRPGNENVDDIAPPPSSSSGGGPGGDIQGHHDVVEDVRGPDLSNRRRFMGDGSNRSTRIRWKKYALSALSRFSPAQLRITISGLYADLLEDNVCLATALTEALQRTPDTFDELLPPGFMTSRLKQCQEDFVCSMTRHWSKARCLDIKFRNWLSREKYDQVRRSLSSTFTDGVWVLNSHNGTFFPQLVSRYVLDKVRHGIARDSGLKQFAAGLGASVDIRTLVQVRWMFVR